MAEKPKEQLDSEKDAVKDGDTQQSGDAGKSTTPPSSTFKTDTYEERLQRISSYLMKEYDIPEDLSGIKTTIKLNTKLNLRKRLQYVVDEEVYVVLNKLLSKSGLNKLSKGSISLEIGLNHPLSRVIQKLTMELGLGNCGWDGMNPDKFNVWAYNRSDSETQEDVSDGSEETISSRRDFLHIYIQRNFTELYIFGQIAIYIPETIKGDDRVIRDTMLELTDWSRYDGSFLFNWDFCEDCKVLNVYMRSYGDIDWDS